MIRYEEHKGQFIKHCPCTPDVVPCGYYNMNLHTGCPFDCSYCILQAYLETREPVYFTNYAEIEKELEEVSQTQQYLRIGTGELSDSLAFDGLTNYSQKILKIMEKFPGVIFEFKTKSTGIDNVLSYGKSIKNVVMAWSLNPEEVIRREELATPGLVARLKVLKQAAGAGFKIGIHFDPIIYFNGWKASYRGLIEEISRVITPSQVAWWSLGALRFPYPLREHLFKHKDSRLFEGELIKGLDGKYRYFKPLRFELFRYIQGEIHRIISREVPLYLCMEDKEMWKAVLPWITPEESEVNKFLYNSVFRES